MNRNQYELYHYGVKGMKWGHRKQRETTGPRTNWGKNRAYAKAQDAENKAMWKNAKATYKTERKAATNKSELKSAKSKYKAEKKRYEAYNFAKNTYSNSYGMSKAARGKQMQKLGVSAKQPVSNLKTSKVIASNAQAMLKQQAKYTVATVATGAAMYAGAKYLQKRAKMNVDMSRIPRLGEGDTIYLKPRQYKVR